MKEQWAKQKAKKLAAEEKKKNDLLAAEQYSAIIEKQYRDTKAKNNLTITQQQAKIKSLEEDAEKVVEVPVDIAIDEKPGDHDDVEFQQPSPFRKSTIWHPQEIFHDLELKSGGNKRTEKQVAFKRGLFSRYLPELQVLVYQLMNEQEKPSGRKRKTRGNQQKSGAVWRACAYAYWHFHFVRHEGEDLPDRIVNIEDDGACNKEPFCLKSAQLPTPLLSCLARTTKSGCKQKTAEAEWNKIKAWTKKFKETALAAKPIDPGAACTYAQPTGNDRS
jgi:hypothetical protein